MRIRLAIFAGLYVLAITIAEDRFGVSIAFATVLALHFTWQAIARHYTKARQ